MLFDDPCIRVERRPRKPEHRGDGNRFEHFTSHGTAKSLAGDVAPQAPGLTISHDQAVAPQHPGHLKGVAPAAKPAGVNHARMTERSPGHRDGVALHAVVDDFVGIQLPQRVGPDLVAHDDPNHRFFGSHLIIRGLA